MCVYRLLGIREGGLYLGREVISGVGICLWPSELDMMTMPYMYPGSKTQRDYNPYNTPEPEKASRAL